MPSASLIKWRTVRAASLDEIEAAHSSLGGTGPGRRYATQQVNHAYVVLLSSQFQVRISTDLAARLPRYNYSKYVATERLAMV